MALLKKELEKNTTKIIKKTPSLCGYIIFNFKKAVSKSDTAFIFYILSLLKTFPTNLLYSKNVTTDAIIAFIPLNGTSPINI